MPKKARAAKPINPRYTQAAQAKLQFPPEIYGYAARVRRDAGCNQPKMPAPPELQAAAPSGHGLRIAYAVVGILIWFALANVTPGV